MNQDGHDVLHRPASTPGTTRRGMFLQTLAAGAVGAAGAAAVGCGMPDTGTAAPKVGQAPATISFSHWGTESGLGVMNREAARQFMQQYPNIKVDLVFKPDTYLTHLQTMVAGGSAPDVFDISTPDFGPPAKDGWARPVDDYIKRDQGKGLDWNVPQWSHPMGCWL